MIFELPFITFILLILGTVQCNTEAGFFQSKSLDSIHLNKDIIKIQQTVTPDTVLSLSIPNLDLDQFKEFYVPVNESELNGFYNMRMSWDALSPIEIYKFDIIKANNTDIIEDGQRIYIYLKYKYDCFPLMAFEDNLNVKILISSTVLGFIPLDMVPVVKLVCMTAVVGFIGGHYIYKFLSCCI
ncbi:hypothetical protein WICPIJ_003020 [Wickerhamomyces pijperi]|uniref:Uncharacterized protein n=1 Tax=Wickerhamomyces pijperi TaxID=599730 RepID=A0A9P8QAN0_WICPI|nr:hypothetical protein WICPIJ_003020 [Wickerhamomyces pijperi]